MITPALELQGASQLIDHVGTQTAQSSDAASSGEFGMVFASSLSGTSAATGSSSGEVAVVPLVPKALASNQFDGSARSSTSRAAASTVPSASAATSEKTGIATLVSLNGHASVGALQQESDVPLSSADAKVANVLVSAATVPSEKTGAQPIPEGSRVSPETLVTSKVANNDSADGQKIASASPQAVLANTGGSTSAQKTATSQSSSKAESIESTSKSKAAGQTLSQTPSHLATSSVANDLFVAGLVASASSGTFIATSVASSATAHGLNAGVGTVSALSSQLIQPKLAIPGASTTQSALAAQVGAEAGRSGALAAWGSVEPTISSGARNTSGLDRGGLEQVSQASSETQLALGRAVAEGESAPVNQFASNAGRSTAISVPTSFTIRGEQRRPAIANDSLEAASGGRPGLTGISASGRLHDETVSQSAGGASTGSVVVNAQTIAAFSATAISKTSSGKTNVASNPIQPGATKSGVAGSSASLLEASAAAQQSNSSIAASSELQDSATVSSAGPTHNNDVQSASTRNLPVSSVDVSQASQPSTSRSATSERAKAIGTSGSVSASSVPSSTSASQDSTDRGVSSDPSNNLATTHVSVPAAADHIVVPATFDGAGGATSVIASVASTAFHQAVASTPIASAQHSSGAVSSLTAATGTELGHSVGASHAALSSEPHQTLEATPTSLEVGVHSGTQGWLKIRAEVGGEGQVSASLAATSPSGDQILKGQLPALNAYLHSEQISLTASIAERTGIAHGVVAHDFGSSALQTDAGSTNGQDASLLHNGAGQSGLAHGGRSEGDGASGVATRVESHVPNASSYTGRVETGASSLQSVTQDSSGQWLNVTV